MRERHIFWDVAPVVLLLIATILLCVLVFDGYRRWDLMERMRREQETMVKNTAENRKAMEDIEKRQLDRLQQMADLLAQGVKTVPGNDQVSTPDHPSSMPAFRPVGYDDLPPGVPIPKLPNVLHGDENAEDGDWLVETLGSEPNSLNPLIDNDSTASSLFSQAHDALATRMFEDLSVWEPRLARAWTKELVCRAYVKDIKAADLAVKLGQQWNADLRKKLQIKRISAESDDVLRIEIADVNNDYRDQLAKDAGDHILKQYWFFMTFQGQKLPDKQTDLTSALLAPRIINAVKSAPGFTGRLLPTYNREGDVVLIVLGDDKARDQARKALKDLEAREDNKAWLINPRSPEGGTLEKCLSLDLEEEYWAQEKPVFTFYLRKDVKWHDGKPFTGRDVVFTYNTTMNPKIEAGSLRNYYQDCESCALVGDDPYVVRFTWLKPYFAAFEFTAGFEPMAEHYYRFEDPKTFNEGPQNQRLVGNGAYKLEKWERGQEIVYVRNEDYYREKPHFHKVVYKIVNDPTVSLNLLEAGKIDFYGLIPSQMSMKENDPEFRRKFDINISVANVYRYIGWNARKPYFKDREVRQALTMLTDQEKICREIQRGYALPLYGNVHPDSPMYWSEIAKHKWPYDPERAKKQLDEAGWKDTDGDGIRDKDGTPFSFTLMIVANSPEYEAMANLIKDSFSKAGIQVQINNLEWAAFLQKIERLQFDACILGWRLGMTDDPYQLWHSSQTGEKKSNFCNFVNKEADRLIVKARTELDEAKRKDLLARFQKIILEEQPYTFLFVSKRLVAYDKRIHNVKFKLVGSNSDRWWVPKSAQKYKD